MSVSKNMKIHQRGDGTLIEGPASTTIYPGMLIEPVTGSTTNQVRPHSTAAGFAELILAQEDAAQGKTVADAYAALDPVNAIIEERGNLALLRLKAGTNYTVGMKLCSYGDGTFKQVTGSEKQDLAVVIDATDLSASSAVDTLVKCRIM